MKFQKYKAAIAAIFREYNSSTKPKSARIARLRFESEIADFRSYIVGRLRRYNESHRLGFELTKKTFDEMFEALIEGTNIVDDYDLHFRVLCDDAIQRTTVIADIWREQRSFQKNESDQLPAGEKHGYLNIFLHPPDHIDNWVKQVNEDGEDLFKVGPIEKLVLRTLWKAKGKLIKTSTLNREVFTDSPSGSRNRISMAVSSLNKKLIPQGLKISSWKREGYALRTLESWNQTNEVKPSTQLFVQAERLCQTCGN